MTMKAFRAVLTDANGTLHPQVITPGVAYQNVLWRKLEVDLASGFDLVTGTWKPPAGLVCFNTGLWAQAGVNGQVTGKIWKNYPTDLAAGIASNGSYANTSIMDWGVFDIASGDDVYSLGVYNAGTTPVTIDANHAHTWWSGAWWSP